MRIQTEKGYRLALAAIKAYRKEWGLRTYPCPFCSGCKVKPYTKTHQNQTCTDCNKDGEVTRSQLVKWSLCDPLPSL